jgi:hypothetical protein
MPTTQNALKKLKKAGATVERLSPARYLATLPTATVAICDQEGTAISIYVKRRGAQDDLTTDYFAGTFCHSTAQALKIAARMES